jgi:hypothetical protein
MHHNPAKNVLHVVADSQMLAKRFGKREEDVRSLLDSAKSKMYAARLKRRTPYVDRTIYTGWNGLCISAYLAAGRALVLPEATTFALKSLDRVLAGAWDRETGLSRVVAYGESGESTRSVPAVLEDFAFLGNAVLDAWEVTSESRYFRVAEQIAERLLDRFYDESGGGFFDTEKGGSAGSMIGVLSAQRKPLQDSPTPAGNSVAATLLLRLHGFTNKEIYRRRAEETLQTFAGVVEHLGLYAASYAQALRRAISGPMLVCVVGDDALAEDLAAAATAKFQITKSILRIRPDQLNSLPPALAETVPHMPGIGTGSMAVVCRGSVCLPPVRDPQELMELLRSED